MLSSVANARVDFARDIYTVSRLTAEVRAVLDGSFPLLWVQGEVCSLSRPASGHLYFNLKDGASQVRCAFFRAKARLTAFKVANGQEVLVRARVGLYEARGDFQLIVEHLEPAGDGALRIALEELKRRLAAEGLFAEARKRQLPDFPSQIGLITSASGAALHDLLTVLRRRFPLLPVLIYPSAVQGERAADALVAALELANRRRDCDVLVIARGGGSFEDLMPFNDERLARAIAASPQPVVTGIGHEVDISIADLVADRRGATPSAAASLVTPDAAEAGRRLERLKERVMRAHRHGLKARLQQLIGLKRHLDMLHPRTRLEQRAQRVDELARRLERAAQRALVERAHRLAPVRQRLQANSPAKALRFKAVRLEALAERLRRAGSGIVDRRRRRLAEQIAGLDARSPLGTLARGFAIVTDHVTGTVIHDAAQLLVGSRVDVRVQTGRFSASVIADDPDDGQARSDAFE